MLTIFNPPIAIFPNILIVFATIMGILRWHFKTRTGILLAGVIASCFSATYFYALDCKMAYTIGYATTFATMLLLPFPNLSVFWKFMIGFLAYGSGVYLYGFTFLSLLPIAGFTLGRIASTFATPINMKKCYWSSSFMWFSFNVLNHTWAAMLMEMFNLLSNGWSLFKDFKKKNSNSQLLVLSNQNTSSLLEILQEEQI